ncbi:MAG TPA: pitrilysin family protein [Candidatus Bathyarchaeia archaeon]|nr:pitrilysin family protein [Candidatus Bathyarchaeia archaeon]
MKIRMFLASAALLVLAPALALAETGAVKLPPYKEHALKNGLRVFIMETREVPLVSLQLLVPAGSATDDPGAEGVANLTGRLLPKGAAGLTAEQIAESIEEVGGAVNVETGRDYATVNGDFLAKDLDRALDIVGKIVLSADFPKEEVEREKGLVVAEIRAEKERPSTIATREFVRALGADHPYAHAVAGSEESVGALTREKVLAYYKAHYVPRGAILAVVGDVDGGAARKLIEAKFGAWKGDASAAAIPALIPRKLSGRTLFVINKEEATQSQIRIGNLSVERTSPDYFPLLVANSVLGGGFTSRLMDEIRVTRGLSYGASSGIDHLKAGGFFGVYTYTKNKTLRETIDVALGELEKIRTEKISDAELAKTKTYITGLFPFNIERNADLAGWITDLAYYGLPLTFVETYGPNVDKVTPDDAQRVAREQMWLDDNLILVLTRYEETKEQLAGLGKIETINVDQVK